MPKKSDNRTRFTVSYLNRQLKPAAKVYRVYDEDPDRLSVRVLPSGKRVFEVVARINGNTKTSKIYDVPDHMTADELANVRARARERLEALARGDDSPSAGDDRLLIENVAESFLEAELDRLREEDHRIPHISEPRSRWPENERRKMDAFLRFQDFLNHKNAELAKQAKPEVRYITDLDKDLIDDFILNYRYYNPRVSKSAADLVPMSLSTRNKDASAFSTLMKWSAKNKLITANPYIDRTETPLPESDPLFLEDDEFDYLIEELESDYEGGDTRIKIRAAAILLFAFTGSRNSETLKLKWRDDGEKFTNYVDLQNMRIVYQDHKTRKAHNSTVQTAMSASAKALLQKLREDVGVRGPYIFYSDRSIAGHLSRQTTNNYFVKRMRPALIKRFKWLEPTPGYSEPNPKNLRKSKEITQYNLRHTFATISLSSGDFSVFEVQTQLKHKDYRTTQKYAGVSDKILTGLASKMR
jgi:integrase